MLVRMSTNSRTGDYAADELCEIAFDIGPHEARGESIGVGK